MSTKVKATLGAAFVALVSVFILVAFAVDPDPFLGALALMVLFQLIILAATKTYSIFLHDLEGN